MNKGDIIDDYMSVVIVKRKNEVGQEYFVASSTEGDKLGITGESTNKDYAILYLFQNIVHAKRGAK